MKDLIQLSRSTAHDVNNILTVITTYYDELYLKYPFGSVFYEELVPLHKNTNRIAALIKQLLISLDKQRSKEPKCIDVTSSIVNLLDLISKLVRNNMIELVVNHPKEKLLIKVSQNHFEQIIINLVMNAINAMPNGGQLTIDIENLKIDKALNENGYHNIIGNKYIPEGDYVSIKVKDTGVGIQPNNINKIFKLYFSTKEEKVGTGIGLSIVYNIIKKAGGILKVKTALNQGTTMAVFLHKVPKTKHSKPQFGITN